MSARYRFVIAALALMVLSVTSFLTGRHRANQRLQSLKNNPSERCITTPAVVPADIGPSQITYMGSWSFIQAYPVIRAAPPSQREKWAKELEQMPDGPKKWSAMNVFYKSLVQTDPKQAVALAMNLSSELERIRVAGFMSVVTPYRAMDELARLMASFPRKDLFAFGSDQFNNTIEAWSAVDPVAVARFLEGNVNENVQANRASLVRYWAAYDPSAAKAWLARTQMLSQDSDGDSDSSEVTKGLVEGWFENDRAEAIKFVLSNQNDEKFDAATGSLTETLLRESPDEARAFVNRLNERAKSVAFVNAMNAMDFGPEPDPRRHATDEVQSAPKRSPEFVADWLLKFPPEDRISVMNTLSKWDSVQPDRFVNWLTHLPSATRSQVLGDCALAASEKQIAAVLALPDVHVRDEILDAIVSQLKPKDAAVILENPRLSEAERAHLASLVPRETEEGSVKHPDQE